MRWVFVRILRNKTAVNAKACPIRVTKMLSDNGKEFTDRLFASRERQPSGEHEFNRLC